MTLTFGYIRETKALRIRAPASCDLIVLHSNILFLGIHTCQIEHQPIRGFLIVGMMRSGRKGLSKAALNL